MEIEASARQQLANLAKLPIREFDVRDGKKEPAYPKI
jgi:hypothetical protein